MATMTFQTPGAATVVSAPNLSYCYFGQSCGFIRGYVSYILPGGTTATLAQYSGEMIYDSANNSYTVTGVASGLDNNGKAVTMHTSWTFTAFCRSGRGGGCRKTFIEGSFVVE
jgi:hypothetical protein